MLSFSKFCKEVIVELAQSPAMLNLKEPGLYTFKQPKHKYKPSKNIHKTYRQDGEIFLLMTPEQFYDILLRASVGALGAEALGGE